MGGESSGGSLKNRIFGGMWAVAFLALAISMLIWPDAMASVDTSGPGRGRGYGRMLQWGWGWPGAIIFGVLGLMALAGSFMRDSDEKATGG